MNKDILNNLGLNQFVKDVEKKKCPFCKIEINEKDFRDRLSLKEYYISGLCQKCQDKVFGV